MFDLTQCPIFLGHNDVENLHFEEKEYLKGDIILSENENLSSVGILKTGRLEINSFDINGIKIIHRIINLGDCFGVNFVFYLNSIYNVIATENSHVLYLKSEDIVKDVVILNNLISILAKENSQLEGKLLHITRKTTKEKLMSFLLEQAKIHGKLSFKIKMNRRELAEYLGVERSAMCWELSKLARDGVLTYSKFKFTLL